MSLRELLKLQKFVATVVKMPHKRIGNKKKGRIEGTFVVNDEDIQSSLQKKDREIV